jgi:VWFA-related protein
MIGVSRLGFMIRSLQERKATLLITDGVDTRSRLADQAGTLAGVEESNDLIYGVQYDTKQENRLKIPSGISQWFLMPDEVLDSSGIYARADKYMQRLTSVSGGRLYLAQEGSNLKAVFAGIADELRHQYTLCYYSGNQRHDGSFRSIRVEVGRPGLKVRARKGYLASKQSAAK